MLLITYLLLFLTSFKVGNIPLYTIKEGDCKIKCILFAVFAVPSNTTRLEIPEKGKEGTRIL
jgi:hypothetical protein